jgi:DTW domain-containing protein YfiP
MAREQCGRCRRPQSHCLCAFIAVQSTHTPIYILQHSDEYSHPFTTSRIATMGASSARLFSGIDFPEVYFAGLSRGPLYLLYDAHNYQDRDTAKDVVIQGGGLEGFVNVTRTNAPSEPSPALDKASVIVLDGSWRNTRELLLRNNWLTRLPLITLSNSPKSIYSVRKSGREGGVATIEAISALLVNLEPTFDQDQYLSPLRHMLEQQRQYQAP